jgi:hypothetical protein
MTGNGPSSAHSQPRPQCDCKCVIEPHRLRLVVEKSDLTTIETGRRQVLSPRRKARKEKQI